MTEAQPSKYWLDLTVADVIKHYPTGQIIVSSGVSPSGSYHIGNFREVLTADALAWGLRQAGRKAKHLHVADNMDPLRRRYPFLPEKYEQYVGWPLCLIPDPTDCHSSYADHYFAEFIGSAHEMGVEMEVVKSYEDQYKTGRMTPYIEQVMDKLDLALSIFEQVAGRTIEANWSPLQVISEDNKLVNASRDDWDLKKQTVAGVDYTSGRVKLNWRLDWPARWALHGVQVEPYGKEHATKGGSYDTGAEFARQIFGVEPPYAVPYDTINLLGETKKMSSSLGNVVTPKQALEIMPAEILRYFVLRSRPGRVVYFDPGLGLYNLVDEYSKIEEAAAKGQAHEFQEAYNLARAGAKDQTISSVPFSHLVAVYQAARGDLEAIISILERTGYKSAAGDERAVLAREVAYVANWLAKYAPDKVKFEVQADLPQADLTENQKDFLKRLAERAEALPASDGQAMHDAIYDVTGESSVKPAEAFQAIYQVILAKDSGPKAGWFLASLDRDWLVKRLKLES